MRRSFLILLACCALLPAQTFRRLYVFGDSYSDTGAGYVDGNGPTAVAYLAKGLGFELIAANDPKVAKDSSLNFAVSGAQTGRGEGRKLGSALLGYGMQNQVDDFARLVSSKHVQFDAKHTLLFLAGGLNDRRLPSETTVANLKGEIRKLYELGGRHFLVAVLPEAISNFSEVGKRLNPELAKIPGEIAKELPGIHIANSGWGRYLDEVMRNPAKYGITNTTDKCAGRALMNEDATPCATPNAYYYYHSGHPSTAVHKIAGERLRDEVLAFGKERKQR
jgi:phospholipase/lecithinase/hemolysin